jgi:hypothetical protein
VVNWGTINMVVQVFLLYAELHSFSYMLTNVWQDHTVALFLAFYFPHSLLQTPASTSIYLQCHNTTMGPSPDASSVLFRLEFVSLHIT